MRCRLLLLCTAFLAQCAFAGRIASQNSDAVEKLQALGAIVEDLAIPAHSKEGIIDFTLEHSLEWLKSGHAAKVKLEIHEVLL